MAFRFKLPSVMEKKKVLTPTLIINANNLFICPKIFAVVLELLQRI